MLTLNRPDGSPITKWQEWTQSTKDHHWKAGRSVMEIVRSSGSYRDHSYKPEASKIFNWQCTMLSWFVKMSWDFYCVFNHSVNLTGYLI